MINESTLLPHQIEAKRFIQNTRYCILADNMGLGKSLSALSVTNKAENILIVCPAYLRTNWRNEILKWGLDPKKYHVISYEQVVKDGALYFPSAQIVIFDEAHYLKTVSSHRTKASHHYIQEYKPKAVILLTGTPIKNRIPEFYSLLMLCTYGNKNTLSKMTPYFNFWKFADNFSWGEKIDIGGHTTTKYSGHRNIDELKSIMNTCYLRRLKMDVDLPEMRERNYYIEDKLDISPELKTMLSYIDSTPPKSSHLMTLKADSAYKKAPYTANYAKELLDSGEIENLVIFTDHIKSSQVIAEILGVTAINSTLGLEARQLIVDRFIKGTDKVLVATIGTLSTGVTLVNTHTMIFNDLSWISGDIEQAKKRINRIGQVNDCNYIYMVAGEIDELIIKTIKSKAKTIEAVV